MPRNNTAAVIGAGPAGALAAITAGTRRECRSRYTRKIRITGKKLRITGKGRCNVTNNCRVMSFSAM